MSRPKGYAQWDPQDETLRLIENVKTILDEYRQHGAMTARQVFYRLVGAYDYPKTERDYKNLCEKLVRARRARRARMIPFSAIRDDGTDAYGGQGYESAEGFWEGVWDQGRYYRRDRSAGQDVRIELWCEAAGMAPQLNRATTQFDINVYATGGFSSVTVTHEIAQRVIDAYDLEEKETVFMHVGDYDPSGESIFNAMAEDVAGFVSGRLGGTKGAFRPVRVALTEDQVIEHDLPTAPAKVSDTRSRNWEGETCQAEAMPPDLLATTVRLAVQEEYDLDVWQSVLDAEKSEGEEIREELDRLRGES